MNTNERDNQLLGNLAKCDNSISSPPQLDTCSCKSGLLDCAQRCITVRQEASEGRLESAQDRVLAVSALSFYTIGATSTGFLQ